MAINTHQADHIEYIQDSNNKKHYLNAEYLDGHSYADISNAIGGKADQSAIHDGTLTIQKNGSTIATFTANQDKSATANIIVPTSINGLTGGTVDGNITLAKELIFTNNTNPFIKMSTQGNTYFFQSAGGQFSLGPTWDLATKWSVDGSVQFPKKVDFAVRPVVGSKEVALKSEIPSITNKGATLDWGTPKTIATIGSTDITAKLPGNPNTDTKVTSAANHYAPTADPSAQLSVDASSTTAATWDKTALVTGVNLQRDSKGHVTGVTVDSVKMPAIPDISNLVPYTGASKDVDLGKHSLFMSNKTGNTGNPTVKLSAKGISEDDCYCEISPTSIFIQDPGSGTMYCNNYIESNGLKIYLPGASYTPSGSEAFVLKSDLSKLLDKGTSSTVVNQVVYNPVEMKKALTVPSIQGTKYTDSSGSQQSLFTLGGTTDTNSGSSSLTLYRNRAGNWDSATIAFTPADGLKINNYAVGVQDWVNIPASYILTNGDGITKDVNGCVKLKSNGGTSDDFIIDSYRNGKLHSKITFGSTGPVGGGWCIDGSKILTESSISTQQWTLTSTSGTITTVNICVK